MLQRRGSADRGTSGSGSASGMGAGLPRLRGNHNIAMREGKTADKNKVYLLKVGRIAGVFSGLAPSREAAGKSL